MMPVRTCTLITAIAILPVLLPGCATTPSMNGRFGDREASIRFPFSGWGWLLVLLVIPEPIFIGLALVFWLTEEQRLITEWHKASDESSLWHFMPW